MSLNLRRQKPAASFDFTPGPTKATDADHPNTQAAVVSPQQHQEILLSTLVRMGAEGYLTAWPPVNCAAFAKSGDFPPDPKKATDAQIIQIHKLLRVVPPQRHQEVLLSTLV